MDVHLLVYDLSQGLARQMSMSFLGIQLDAVYHTSIELDGREYVYDGGILAITPYSSHLGRPMERLLLGRTSLAMDVVEAYLDSVRPLYTAEAYDLFQHNCNNFTDSFANFLLGHGIPAHITGMPQAVLDTPMGRMLLPQLVQSVNAGRRQNGNALLGLRDSAQTLPPQHAQQQQQQQPAPRVRGPPHPHHKLRLPSFHAGDGKPVLFEKVPPLDKLVGKLGADVARQPAVLALRAYLDARAQAATATARAGVAIPDLAGLAAFVRASVASMPRATLFAAVDLLRCSLWDPRVSGYFAEEAGHATILAVLAAAQDADAPYALRLVTLQALCNLFSTPLFAHALFSSADSTALCAAVVSLVTSSFLDDGHSSVRAAAASLLYDMALAGRRGAQADEKDEKDGARTGIPTDAQVELAASVVEAIGQEETSAGALQGMLTALGHLVYGAPLDGELVDLLRALDAQSVVAGKKKTFPGEPLVDEVGSELLGKGLQRP